MLPEHQGESPRRVSPRAWPGWQGQRQLGCSAQLGEKIVKPCLVYKKEAEQTLFLMRLWVGRGILLMSGRLTHASGASEGRREVLLI